MKEFSYQISRKLVVIKTLKKRSPLRIVSSSAKQDATIVVQNKK